MRKQHLGLGRLGLGILSLSLCVAACGRQAGDGARVSRPGEYEGYSQPRYGQWVRASQYVTVRDGTRLAVDIFRPAVDGKPATEPLPVIWTHTRYGRVMKFLWRRVDILHQFPWLQTVLKHGYIIAAADVRGSGASFGTRHGEFTPEESRDAYDLTEWFAARPWCSGKVGMFGRSYLGAVQYLAAGQAPPHLAAVFPEMAPVDLYELTHPGGIRRTFVDGWGGFIRYLDTKAAPAPVDADPTGALLRAAREQHAGNVNVPEEIKHLPYRDSVLRPTGRLPYEEFSPARYFQAIQASGVPIYHFAGWLDGNPRDMLLCYTNLSNPQKITIGPWHHTGGKGFDLAAEHLRWFDYWLKGIDTGVMDEAPIHYWVMDAQRGREWRTARQWPPEARPTEFFFHAGPSGSIASVNDGLLTTAAPGSRVGRDVYTVDYTATSGRSSRWANLNTGSFKYPNMAANDRKGLTYTTPPLAADLEVVGHPVVHLWISSPGGDGDFFVYLEEIDPRGRSRYVTEGAMRASHRAVAPPPYDFLGLPYHRSYERDIASLPINEPVELVFDLLPMAKVFRRGHRLRLTVTCADRDNAVTPALDP
ncbi:MAG: CocE/NonD family hydrolase, partial [Bacteroidota bacterium]